MSRIVSGVVVAAGDGDHRRQDQRPLTLKASFDPDTSLGMHGEFDAAIIPTTPGTYTLVALAGVLAVTAVLQGLAPPTSGAATPAVHPLVLRGQDFGTTVRVTLTVTPGLVGFNHFDAKVVDFDTARPVGGALSLRFTLPSRPDLGSSSLTLPRTGPDVFAANGANLSIDGTWTVAVDVQGAAGGVEIPFTVTPRRPPEKIVVAPQGPGIPTLYTLQLPGGRWCKRTWTRPIPGSTSGTPPSSTPPTRRSGRVETGTARMDR